MTAPTATDVDAVEVDGAEVQDVKGEVDGVDAATAAASTPPADADELSRVRAERDEYLAALQRLQAEYDNYRRRAQREQAEQPVRGEQRLAERLLDVLDGFDHATAHGLDELVPLQRSLTEALTTAGLQRVHPIGEPFDPALHHAVEHEQLEETQDSDGEPAQPTVVEVLRAGYRWGDRLLRPAMVKVRG